jgi:hypothetical protein
LLRLSYEDKENKDKIGDLEMWANAEEQKQQI